MSGARHGRTYFWAKDSAWWRRERIVLLGQEFGAEGPAIIDWLSCEAKAQDDGGWVKSGPAAVGAGCFVAPDRVCPVLSRSVQLGLVEDYESVDGLFTCRISGWKADQEIIAERLRKREQRAKAAAICGETVPARPALSQVVPTSPRMSPTGQDRTVSKQPPYPPEGDLPASDSLEAPVRPLSQRKRDQVEWQAEFDAWAGKHFPGVEPHGLADLVSWVQSRKTPATPDAVKEFAANAPNFAHVLEVAA